MVDVKSLHSLDFPLLLNVLALAVMGVLLIAGATYGRPDMEQLWIRQTLWICIGIAAIGFCVLVRIEWFLKWSPLFYFACLGLLVLVFFVDPIKGARSWIKLPGLPISFQPSEFMKIVTILFLAHRLGRRSGEVKGFWGLFEPLLIGAVPAVMVLAQPDLGTAMIFAPITLIMMYIAGLHPAYFLLLFSPFLGFLGISSQPLYFLIWVIVLCGILVYALWRQVTLPVFVIFVVLNIGSYAGLRTFGATAWEKVPTHWQGRIKGYLDPEFDPQHINWNLNQSKIAVGSGGFWGHGWGQGTQSRLQFLPEVETDFVFSVMGEQWGFLGCMIFLALITFLVVRGLIRAQESRHLAAALIISGVMTLYASHVIINAGMSMGLLPITGLPLTFVSKGGSFMMTNLLGIGLVLGAQQQRFSRSFGQ
ncbi:MAG: FtsW/RodA/SpoVE family cell cycle protein [bacterium]